MTMRILMTSRFRQFIRKERISNKQLCQLATEVQSGLIDADLGAGLYKKRMARVGGGKSGGYRTLLAFAVGSRLIFLIGFAKKDMDNISFRNLQQLKALARELLIVPDDAINRMLDDAKLWKVICDEPD